MNNVKVLCIIILVYYLFIFELREGINLTKGYFLDKFQRDDISIDVQNSLLNRNGCIIQYKQINEYVKFKHKLLMNKPKVQRMLQNNQIPVCTSYVWNNELSEDENVEHVKKLSFPLVIKPVTGQKGCGVKTDLNTLSDVTSYVRKLKSEGRDVFIEEQIIGKEYRIMVLNNVLIGVTLKTPASVEGNGMSSLDDLISALNDSKKEFRKLHTVDDAYIKYQGYTRNSIIRKHERVLLTNVANMSNGSEVKNVEIHEIHPRNVTLFKKINQVLGIKLSGIDYICQDISVAHDLHGKVIEVNCTPGFDIHYDVTPILYQDALLDNVISNIF